MSPIGHPLPWETFPVDMTVTDISGVRHILIKKSSCHHNIGSFQVSFSNDFVEFMHRIIQEVHLVKWYAVMNYINVMSGCGR